MPQPPYLKRSGNPDKGVQGRKAEKSLASRIGAHQTPGSGAGWSGAKGDMKVGDFLIENKSSTRGSFTVNHDVLLKIYNEALAISRKPALSFQFVNGKGDSQKRDRWVCVPESVFEELLRG